MSQLDNFSPESEARAKAITIAENNMALNISEILTELQELRARLDRYERLAISFRATPAARKIAKFFGIDLS